MATEVVPPFPPEGVCGISSRFQLLSPTTGQIPRHYSPVRRSTPHLSTEASKSSFPLDLHVLSLPPAFNLSHDQTLQLKVFFASFASCSMNTVLSKFTFIDVNLLSHFVSLIYRMLIFIVRSAHTDCLFLFVKERFSLSLRGCAFYAKPLVCQGHFSNFFLEAFLLTPSCFSVTTRTHFIVL